MNSSPFGNAHGDVLNATASTAEEKDRLVAEIKGRAKAAFGAGQMPLCEVLYTKAIETVEDAALYANRSTVRLSLGKAKDAAADAKKAVEVDPTYAKGFYRLGQAEEKSERFDAAIEAYAKGAALEPNSKVWPSARAKAEKKAEEFKARPPAPPPAPATVHEHFEVPARIQAQVDAERARKLKERASSSSSSSSKAGGDMRGYKVDSQGRKTTFFNNELDDKTKALIGDIAPKKVATEVRMDVAEGSSSWNQAGTFEERNHTKWATSILRTKCTDLMVDLPPRQVGTMTVPRYLTVKEFKEFRGDASTASARGKKKWIVDLTFTLSWEFALDDKGAVAKGTAKFCDIGCDTVDDDEVPDCIVDVDPLTPAEARPVVDSHVKSTNNGLRPAVFAIVADLVSEFRSSK